jgi:hypothetical protein
MKRMDFFCCLAILSCCFCGLAQENPKHFFIRPSLGLAGGQLDGDSQAGYNKPGLFGGGYVGRSFNEKWGAAFGLTFIQKGAKKNQNVNKGDYEYFTINLNYLEVPFHAERKFKSMKLLGGFYYSRLLGSSETQNGAQLTGRQFEKRDLGYLLGGEAKIKNNFYFGIRFSYSLRPIYYYVSPIPYRPNIFSGIFNKGMYNNVMLFYFHMEILPKKNDEAP